MHNDLLDILSRKTMPITNEQLISYLKGDLTDEERHEIEKAILNSGVDNEALEGLLMVANKEKISQYQHDIKKGLREKLQQKSPKRKKSKQLQLSWILLMTGGILAFIILLWLIMHLLQNTI